MRFFAITLVLILSRISVFHVRGVCKKLEFQPSQMNKLLQNHVIFSVTVSKESDCDLQCYLNNRCLSYNYIQSTKTCQLSDSDKYIDPDDLVTGVDTIYRGTENACRFKTCRHNKKCKPDLLTNTGTCICPKGFIGRHCRTVIGEGCKNYQQLKRNSLQSQKQLLCKQSSQAKWYRFLSRSQIAESCRAGSCSENMGWFVGSHPSIREYIVDRQVCFANKTSCCASSTDILVRNCLNYFV